MKPRNQHWTYSDADAYLGNKYERPAPWGSGNTKVVRLIGRAIALRHHWTDIITWKPDGRITIDCNGFRSTTTKARLNAYLPQRYRVFQKDYEWFLSDTHSCFDQVDYFDGMVVRA